VEDRLTVALRVTPRARKAAVMGWQPDGEGRPVLALAVTAAPVEGAANDAVVALLAGYWRVPKSAITLVSGAGSRQKRVEVRADPARLAEIAAERDAAL
jgi:uncharacterized protein YggU (UPF0235/DUF167 family)